MKPDDVFGIIKKIPTDTLDHMEMHVILQYLESGGRKEQIEQILSKRGLMKCTNTEQESQE